MAQVTGQIGGLSCTVIQVEERAQPRFVVVLCHGYGATGHDLVPIGHELAKLPAFRSVRFIFPGAPISLGNFGYGDSRAWWEIDVERYATLDPRDSAAVEQLQRQVPTGLPRARRLLTALVEETARQSDLGPAKVLLGGFSQGAMLATDVSLRLEEAPAGLAIFSGAIVCAEEWERRARARTSLPVFQSHGRQDNILPYLAGQNVYQLLSGAGLSVDYHPFDGGHGIPSEVLQSFTDFLQKRVSLAQSRPEN